MLAELIVKKVVSKALDTIVEKVTSGVLAEMESDFRSVEERLSRIEKTLQRQNMAPLKNAFFYLKLGEFNKAIDGFVQARSLDDFGAVARFWLAVVLALEGRSAHAREQLAEALLLNPFVVPPALSSDVLAAAEGKLRPGTTAVSCWHGTLAKLAYIQDVGFLQRKLRDIRRLPTGPWLNGPIHRVSFSGSHPVFSWNTGDVRAGKEPFYLSTLDLKTGRCMWNRTVGQGKLFFATPRLVVFQPTSKDEQFKLFDLETGGYLMDMDADYFGTVFCPGYDTLTDNPAFAMSNKDMTVDMSWLKKAIGASSGEYNEQKLVMDPFGTLTHYVVTKNYWGGRAEGFSWRPDINIAWVEVRAISQDSISAEAGIDA